jgi:hypothetical protein
VRLGTLPSFLPIPTPTILSSTGNSFEWIPALADEFRTGVVNDEEVEFKRVGTFVWPQVPPASARLSMRLGSGAKNETSDIDVEAAAGKPQVIGIFMHGGGYTQMSAHEKAGTSRIPRRLIKDGVFTEIYGPYPLCFDPPQILNTGRRITSMY